MGEVTDKSELFKQLKEKNEVKSPDIGEPGLKGGDGGGTSGGMAPSMKDYVDAKVAQNLSDMKAEVQGLRADIAKLPTTWVLLAMLLSVAGLVLAAVGYSGTRFSAGMSVADVRLEQLQRDAEQDRVAEEINGKLDKLLANAANQPAAQSTTN